MDNSEFEERALANPDNTDQDFLDALAASPKRAEMLEEIRIFNARIHSLANSVSAPTGLADRLKFAASSAESENSRAAQTERIDAAVNQSNVIKLPARKWSPTRLVSMAAALVLGVGVTYTSLFGNSQPSAQELALGQQVISHIYMELDEINARPGTTSQQVNQVFGTVGATVRSQQFADLMRINFAKPCAILPQSNSAHLAMEGTVGAINIIVINNSPVDHQFTMSDERFDALVIPLQGGNLILVGERNELLYDAEQALNENVSWVI